MKFVSGCLFLIGRYAAIFAFRWNSGSQARNAVLRSFRNRFVRGLPPELLRQYFSIANKSYHSPFFSNWIYAGTEFKHITEKVYFARKWDFFPQLVWTTIGETYRRSMLQSETKEILCNIPMQQSKPCQARVWKPLKPSSAKIAVGKAGEAGIDWGVPVEKIFWFLAEWQKSYKEIAWSRKTIVGLTVESICFEGAVEVYVLNV